MKISGAHSDPGRSESSKTVLGPSSELCGTYKKDRTQKYFFISENELDK